MPRYEDDDGRSMEVHYDRDNNMTVWETYDPHIDVGGGGSLGGDHVSTIISDYEGKGYRPAGSD